jgi:GTP-binding protein Era
MTIPNPSKTAGYNEWFRKLPPETQQILQAVWEIVPATERKTLFALLGNLPLNTNMLRTLIGMAATQFQIAFGNKNKVVIAGPANVGKSTLFNQLIQDQTHRAQVSPLPGTTRSNQISDAGLFTIIDTPGADAVGEVGVREREEALSAASQADFIIIVFDAIQGIKQTELDLFVRLVGLNIPYAVVLNKIDLVRKHERDVVALAAKNLALEADQVVPISATTGQGLDQVLALIALAEPAIVAALAQALPQYRWQLAWRAVISAVSASAVVALTPLPIVDFIPLIAIQSAMILAVARIYQYKLTLARARELVTAFGTGLLGRALFYELSKLGGIPGWMLSAAIASSTTMALGYAASIWFEKGERISGDALTNISRTLAARLIESLRSLGKRKPGDKPLRDHISQVLENEELKIE